MIKEGKMNAKKGVKGYQKKHPDDILNCNLYIKMTAEEKRQLDDYCKLMNIQKSDFVRTLINRKIKRTPPIK